MKKEFLSTTEAARILGTSRMQIIRKIRSGEIRANRIGRNFAIPVKELNPIFKVSTPEELNEIDRGVEKVVKEYGDVLKKLGKE